jgi:RNA polymerase sigma-70 factor, ECF subfamily
VGRYSSLSAEDLIRVCGTASDADAWEEFVSRFDRAISLAVIRASHQWSDLPRQQVDDLVQDTYLKLCSDRFSLLGEFAVRHPDAIVGYIKTVAANVVHDHFKAQHSQKRGSRQPHESLDNIDPASGNSSPGSEGATERQILLQQVDRCLAACSTGPDQERDRLIFWLYYRQGMSAKAIAGLPAVGLTSKGVESAILRLTRLVRAQMVNTPSDINEGTRPGQKGLRPAESF